jgi:TonB-linked SusC/RagA family outer membrane protein
MPLRLGFIAAFLFAFTFYSQAQVTVSGTVTDAENGETLPGVNVLVKGTASGTSTGNDGTFELTAQSEQDTLIFSYIGFQAQEVPINGRSTIDITMDPSVQQLQDLVVTGYTTQREVDVTGSISNVDIDNLNKSTSASFTEKLKGKVSGVQVESNGSPGSRSTVRIRGVSSFQNNDPLYVIDGTPIQGAFNNFLNPEDIESMSVLKDASAASIYGSRANNGVILIKTKNGRPGAPQVTVDTKLGVATPVGGYDDFLIQDALQYHEVVKRSFENANLTVPTNIYGDPDNPTIPNYIFPEAESGQNNDVDESTYSFPNNLIMPGSAGTNWWDELFDPAFTQNYNMNVSGGNDNATYNVSFNYFDQEGTMKENYYKKGTIRVNTQFDAGIFTIGENASFTIDQQNGGIIGGSQGEDTPIGNLIKMQPVVPVYDVNGYFAGAKANGLGNGSNPIAQVMKARNNVGETKQFVGNAFVNASLLDNLEARSNFGFNLGQNRGEGFSLPTPENSEPNSVTQLNENFGQFTNWTWTNTLNYIESFGGRHNIDVLAGTEANRSSGRNINGSLAGFLTNDVNARYIQDALGDPDTKTVFSGGGYSTLLSLFGKVDYNFDERYYFSVTVRRDGSSTLGSNNRWGTFPAFSLGWRISEESFMDDFSGINELKIRAGYGVTGNQQIPGGRTVNQFGGGTGDTFYDIGGQNTGFTQGFRQTAIGNNNLKWEENISYNLGIDAEFLESRLSVALDIYQRETDDLLFNPATPATQGSAAAPFVNIGKVSNKGLDAAVGYQGSVGNDFQWNIDVNGSTYQNEILRIDGQQDAFFGSFTGRGDNIVINQLGSPIGAFYGYKTDGIFANQSEVDAHAEQAGAAPGRFRFQDVNGDGSITANDKTVIGSYHPDFTGGLNLGMQYKNFDFNTFLSVSIGNDIADITKEFTVFRLFSTNVREDILSKSAIVEDGQVINLDEAEYPEINENDTFSSEYSEFFIEDGSYMRMQNLEVGYNVPATVLGFSGLSRLRVYLQAQNLFTITGYNNIDPQLPSNNPGGATDQRDQARGIDRGTYPNNRIFSLGINARF